MITIGQIGCGYWGPNLLRNFISSKNCVVSMLAEADPRRREYVNQQFTQIKTVDSHEEILGNPKINTVVIATPARTHYELACQALSNGKHIFVEKPLAMKSSEIDEIARLAKKSGLIVFTGHVFLYNKAVRYVKGLLEAGDLGDLRYIYAQRLNLGRVRSDVDVLWNFGPHDVSIIDYWLDEIEPTTIQRSGMSFIQDGIDDVVFLNLTYPNRVIANIHLSWLDPHKTRSMVLVGSKKMVIYDDTSDYKIAIHDTNVAPRAILGETMDYDSPRPFTFDYHKGQVVYPEISFVEPLKLEVQHFIDCIHKDKEPLTGLCHTRRVTRILEEASDHQGNGTSPHSKARASKQNQKVASRNLKKHVRS